MDDPKPCPFCGKLPEINKHFREDDYRLVHRCSVIGSIIIDWASRERILEQWNTRI